MDDAMRCDRCRAEVNYKSLRLGDEVICAACVVGVFDGVLTKTAALKETVEKLEAHLAIVRDALDEAVHIVDNHVDGECEECNVACRKINAALRLFTDPAGAQSAGQQLESA